MNKKEYCEKLLKYKDKNMPIYLFLGGKWIFLKGLIIAMGYYLLQQNEIDAKVLGGIAIGYALGKIGAGLMSYNVSKKTWSYSQELFDWEKINSIANDENK